MCSILGILDIKSDPSALRERALDLSKLQRHRGPDWSGIFSCDKAILAHVRSADQDSQDLAAIDVDEGYQNRARTVAKKRIVQAGFRLARQLEKIYGTK